MHVFIYTRVCKCVCILYLMYIISNPECFVLKGTTVNLRKDPSYCKNFFSYLYTWTRFFLCLTERRFFLYHHNRVVNL